MCDDVLILSPSGISWTEPNLGGLIQPGGCISSLWTQWTVKQEQMRERQDAVTPRSPAPVPFDALGCDSRRGPGKTNASESPIHDSSIRHAIPRACPIHDGKSPSLLLSWVSRLTSAHSPRRRLLVADWVSRAHTRMRAHQRSSSAEERFALPPDGCAVSPNTYNRSRHRSLEYIAHAPVPSSIPHSHWALAPLTESTRQRITQSWYAPQRRRFCQA
jgi:hypothetical protein